MDKIKTVILCGGIGYRLKEETEFKPKPMVEIGGKPILWHIMKIYSHWGFNNFLIALGYKGNTIKDYFVNKKYYDGDFTLDASLGKITRHKDENKDDLRITFADTGVESSTGERVRRLTKYIKAKYFMLTYGDGLANINIKELLKFHKKKGLLATVTGVYPQLKYGGFRVNKQSLATKFEKKAKITSLINGGFMVFDRRIFDYVNADSMIEDVFEPLIKSNNLAIYEHKGFFHAMDTYQDMQDLNNMWTENPAWKIWR